MDENRIRENCRVYIDAMRKYMGEGSRPIFASKSCCFKRIYAIVADMGMGTDIVSPGELYTANAAGFPMENAFFHGNNKTDADIEYAMETGIGCFIVDNREELDTVNACAARRGIRQKILLRLTPGIDPHTQKKISTGKVDSKFGTAIETGQALELCKYALGLSAVELDGFHCHIGSQIFDYYPFRDAAEIMLRFIRTLLDECGHEIRTLNLGGGFGVRYVESDPEIDYEANIRGLAEEIQRICAELSIQQPDILMEPGRSMTDNIRYALYESDYTALLANRAKDPVDFCATIAGRCCESGDIIQEDVMLPRPVRGDTLAVLVTGAYNYAMASNYNRIPRPPVVMLRDGKDYVAVRRESYEDLCRNDM